MACVFLFDLRMNSSLSLLQNCGHVWALPGVLFFIVILNISLSLSLSSHSGGKKDMLVVLEI